MEADAASRGQRASSTLEQDEYRVPLLRRPYPCSGSRFRRAYRLPDGQLVAGSGRFDDARRLRCAARPVDVAVTQNYLFWDDEGKPRHLPAVPLHARRPGSSGHRRAPTAGATATPSRPIRSHAKELLVAALRDKDPYLMGIALHTFADTWAHQNFCGLLDDWNDIGGPRRWRRASLPPATCRPCRRPTSPTPAGRTPGWSRSDGSSSTATVSRRRPPRLFRYLRVFLGRSFDDDELVVAKLEAIWAKPSRDERLADYVLCWDIGPMSRACGAARQERPRDRSAFAGAAPLRQAGLGQEPAVPCRRRSHGRLPSRSTRRSTATDLYRWHEAAFEHRRRAGCHARKERIVNKTPMRCGSRHGRACADGARAPRWSRRRSTSTPERLLPPEPRPMRGSTGRRWPRPSRPCRAPTREASRPSSTAPIQ